MSPRAGLNGCRKYRPPPEFDHWAFQPTDSHYTDWPPDLPAHGHSLYQLCYPDPLVTYGTLHTWIHYNRNTKLGIHGATCQKSTKAEVHQLCSLWVTTRRSVIRASHSNVDKYTSLLGYDIMFSVINNVENLAVHSVTSKQNCIVINKFHKLIRKFVRYTYIHTYIHVHARARAHTHTHTQFYGILMMVLNHSERTTFSKYHQKVTSTFL